MYEQATNVVIADDNREFREGLRDLLQVTPDLVVVGEAGTGDEAIALATRLQPDVVLMDLHMPGRNGIEATRRLVGTNPRIGILVLTM